VRLANSGGRGQTGRLPPNFRKTTWTRPGRSGTLAVGKILPAPLTHDCFLGGRAITPTAASPHAWMTGVERMSGDQLPGSQPGIPGAAGVFDLNASACCGEKDSLGYDDPSHPNTNEPGLWGPGGGRVGGVALSPFIKPGTKSDVFYNHYSLLKTVEMIFGLPPLGDARQPQVRPFGADVFTR
jgi:hypothetical protein